MSVVGPTLEAPIDVTDILAVGLERNPDAIALASTEMRWNWRALDAATDRLAGHLVALGLQAGDRVATLMPNRTALLIIYISCFKAGLVVTPLNYRYTAREIDYALEVSGAALLFAHGERKADLDASQRRHQLAFGLVSYGSAPASQLRYEDMMGTASPSNSFPAIQPQHPAAIFFTSGSTGRPKGVIHTFETLGWMFASCGAAFEMTAQDVVLPGSSMSHLGSFMWALTGLAFGLKVVVPKNFDADEILPLLRTEKPTVLCMIPANLLQLVRDRHATKADFASVRVCRCGSDRVPMELEQEFEQLTGFALDEGYGMSEVGLATLNPPSGPIKLGSIGRPNPGFELSLRDESGQEVACHAPGNLFMKTPSLTVGYWQNPNETSKAIHDGWIDSGDVLKVDEDGYFWFCARKKQIIVHDGSNIYPKEVENALLEHPAIKSAAVIGVHDLLHGEIVRAYVVPRADSKSPTAGELIAFARERIGYKAPEELEFLEEMPLNPTGKIDRNALKARASANHAISEVSRSPRPSGL